jgi:hypothetical protein
MRIRGYKPKKQLLKQYSFVEGWERFSEILCEQYDCYYWRHGRCWVKQVWIKDGKCNYYKKGINNG